MIVQCPACAAPFKAANQFSVIALLLVHLKEQTDQRHLQELEILLDKLAQEPQPRRCRKTLGPAPQSGGDAK